MSYQIQLTGDKIQKALVDAAQSGTISQTKTKERLTFNNNASGFGIDILPATIDRCGPLSAADYSRFNLAVLRVAELNQQFSQLAKAPTSAQVSAQENLFALTFYSDTGALFGTNLPIATPQSAGLLSAYGAMKVQKALTVFNARKVHNVEKINLAPAEFLAPSGTLAIDEVDGKLCMYFENLGRYYTAWNASQNPDGLLPSEYAQDGNGINGDGVLFLYANGKWVSGAAGGSNASSGSPSYVWRSINYSIVIQSDDIMPTDKAVLYRYKKGTYGRVQSRYWGKAVGRVHYNGWMKTKLTLDLQPYGSGQWTVKPVGCESFADYATKNPMTPESTKNRGLNLFKKCAIVIERDGKPITDFIKFKIASADGRMVLARW